MVRTLSSFDQELAQITDPTTRRAMTTSASWHASWQLAGLHDLAGLIRPRERLARSTA